MTDEGYTFLPLYDAEVDEDKMQKIINLLNKLGIKDFVRFARKEIHFLNLTDSQIEKLLEAQSNEYKNDFYLLGIRKHPNTPMHHYLQLKNGGKDMSDRYTVINKEEPLGQSVAENGIPCTAKYCVAELNRLFQDNENLETRLKLLSDFTEDFTQQINRSIMVENQTLITELHNIMKLLHDLYEGIDEYYTETLERNDELAIAYARAQLDLITKILDEVKKI